MFITNDKMYWQQVDSPNQVATGNSVEFFKTKVSEHMTMD